MEPYILGISGSPRTDGNTDYAVRFALNAIAHSKGVVADFIRIADQDIKPCLGCRYCMKNGDCVIHNDEFQGLFDKLIHASVVILGAPVYWYGPPGMMKHFIDRTHAYYACPDKVASPVQVGVISVAADSGFSSHEDVMISWLNHYRYPVVDRVRLLAREKGQVQTQPEQMGKLHRFIKSFVKVNA